MSSLSPEQEALVDAVGSIFVEACPGAGKTRALVARFLRRAAAEPRKGVALLSFTNAAIDEVRDRCGGESRVLRAPNFVGTFDSFINRYITGPAYRSVNRKEPTFLEAWDRLESSRIHVAGMDRWLHYDLEWFTFDSDQRATLVDHRIRGKYHHALRTFAAANAGAVEKAASERFIRLVARGLLSSSASRWFAECSLNRPDQAECFAALLSDRFSEVIVDEGQDCGSEEIDVLKLLLGAGVSVVLVADTDQAIFEFRRAEPTALRAFAGLLSRGERLAGNYRSTPSVCKLIACLRAGPAFDSAVGVNADERTPIQVVAYSDVTSLPGAIREAAESKGFAASDVMVLAHRRRDAFAGAGRHFAADTGSRKAAIVARAALTLQSPTAAPQERRRAIESVERVVLGLHPDVSARSLPSSLACERLQVPKRWLRDTAGRLASSSDPKTCTPTEYAAALRSQLETLTRPVVFPLLNLSQNLKAVPEAEWDEILAHPDEQGFGADTVHGAKGKEFAAVALVIPKSLGTDLAGRTSLDCWAQGVDSESRRVLYVGVSRAERLLILAVHKDHSERLEQLLRRGEVPHESLALGA